MRTTRSGSKRAPSRPRGRPKGPGARAQQAAKAVARNPGASTAAIADKTPMVSGAPSGSDISRLQVAYDTAGAHAITVSFYAPLDPAGAPRNGAPHPPSGSLRQCQP